MAKIRDYTLNPPQKLTELNKDSMERYVIGLNNADDAKWYLDLLEANKEKKRYTFDTKDGKHKKGDVMDGYNWQPIRKEFAKRYFPDVIKKKTSSSKKDTNLDILREIAGIK